MKACKTAINSNFCLSTDLLTIKLSGPTSPGPVIVQ